VTQSSPKPAFVNVYLTGCEGYGGRTPLAPFAASRFATYYELMTTIAGRETPGWFVEYPELHRKGARLRTMSRLMLAATLIVSLGAGCGASAAGFS
jgi:hypothetical protein